VSACASADSSLLSLAVQKN